ncbi:hypothetical protein CYY_007772 [Polysphondylium violaceum]|uniref:NDT80/PhoG-like protein n=1 Tax=Polysphondylium violaceum TaxID=133409 RepID=A0A8J4UQN2_9MYCE|nr:hypothetical protein CYY_007772 [Polysphondylium violaceum]
MFGFNNHSQQIQQQQQIQHDISSSPSSSTSTISPTSNNTPPNNCFLSNDTFQPSSIFSSNQPMMNNLTNNNNNNNNHHHQDHLPPNPSPFQVLQHQQELNQILLNNSSGSIGEKGFQFVSSRKFISNNQDFDYENSLNNHPSHHHSTLNNNNNGNNNSNPLSESYDGIDDDLSEKSDKSTTTTTTSTKSSLSNSQKLKKRRYVLDMAHTFNWVPYCRNYWNKIIDGYGHELIPPNLSVLVEKGFTFSEEDNSWVYYRRNHFQLKIAMNHHFPFDEVPLKYINADGNLLNVEHLYLSIKGVKNGYILSPAQEMQVEIYQTNSKREKNEEKVPPPINISLIPSVTISRLHFRKATANNARKQKKPNPQQEFFHLVLTITARCQNKDYCIYSIISDPLIVRTGHPTVSPNNSNNNSSLDSNSNPTPSPIGNYSSSPIPSPILQSSPSIRSQIYSKSLNIPIASLNNNNSINNNNNNNNSSSNNTNSNNSNNNINNINNPKILKEEKESPPFCTDNQLLKINNNVLLNNQIFDHQRHYNPQQQQQQQQMLPPQYINPFSDNSNIQHVNEFNPPSLNNHKRKLSNTDDQYIDKQIQIQQQQIQQVQQHQHQLSSAENKLAPPPPPFGFMPIQDEDGKGWAINDNGELYHYGKVGVNSESPQEALTVHGNVSITGQLFQPSDSRVKERIRPVDSKKQLENILKVRIYDYNLKKEWVESNNLDITSDRGVLAQELETIKGIPNSVKETGTRKLDNGSEISNFLVVNKDAIFMENIGATQELSKKVDTVYIEMENLSKKKIEILGNKVGELEQTTIREIKKNQKRKKLFIIVGIITLLLILGLVALSVVLGTMKPVVQQTITVPTSSGGFLGGDSCSGSEESDLCASDSFTSKTGSATTATTSSSSQLIETTSSTGSTLIISSNIR